MIRTLAAAFATSTCIVALATPAAAQTREYNIPSGSLKSALDAYVRQSGRQVVYRADQVRSARSPGARGQQSAEAALVAILAGSGFTTRVDGNLVAIVREGNASVAANEAATGEATSDNTIVVTGSRIRGAEAASPLISISQEEMKNSGLATLGDVVRSIPQNFGGGQNPGVAPGAEGVNNTNVSASSTINLRGIGSDATLTLLNGHRLAYDYAFQGIDIAGIPIAAVDRMEIVADGASAIYGSDAVAGVANIILKRDYQGVTTSARFGAATEGGNEQQDYSVVSGHVWAGGGLMAVYSYQKNTPIVSRQRSYTSEGANADQTLFPGSSQHSVIVSGHQRLTDALNFVVDATYNRRTTASRSAYFVDTPPDQSGLELFAKAEEYSITPRLELTLSPAWSVALFGTYAKSSTNSDSLFNFGGSLLLKNPALYDNSTRMVELSGQGRLFRINGNDVGLALGGGYRENALDQELLSIFPPSPATGTSFSSSNKSVYGFGEVNIPIISPRNGLSIHRLSLTGAIRYENYSGREEVATPKIGVVFAPIEDIELKASWGNAFKAPTLFELYDIPQTYIDTTSYYGIPGGGTVLFLNGANPDLKSERATTWTATIAAKPRAIPGLRLEVSYFNIDYRDRVLRSPIATLSDVYSNPAYQSLITYAPTIGQVEAARGISPLPPVSFTGQVYDPAQVVAIVDGRNVNAARQKLSGIDFFGNYDIENPSLGKLSISGLASYLRSTQTLLPSQPETQMAGTIFDPPHWRARGALTWSKREVTLNAAINYSGKLIDDRRGAAIDIGTKTTVDVTARFASLADRGEFSGIDLSLSVLNIFNANPRAVRTFNSTSRPYESTNDSAVGRFVSLSIAKRW